MIKKLLIVAATIAVAVPVSAQVPERPRVEERPNGGVPAPTIRREIREERRENVAEVRKEYREEKKEVMEDRKEGLREVRDDRREDRQEDRKEFRDAVTAVQSSSSTPEEKREAIKALLDQRKAEAEARQEAFKAEREKIMSDAKTKREEMKKALEEKVKAFKDKAKAEVVKTLATQFDTVNQNITNALTERVAKIETILSKMSAKADEASSAGKDVVAVRTAIDAAKAKIESARTAISAQTAKSYAIMTTEEEAKQVAKTVREQLGADLEVARASVKAANDAVRSAGQLLATVLGVSGSSNATTTQ